MTDLVPADKFSSLPENYQRRAREIDARVREINRTLSPAPNGAIASAVARMAAQFRPQQDEDPVVMGKEYRAACADLPEWAISEAANDYLWGRVEDHNGRFMPVCAEFAKRVREVIRPLLSERHALRTEAEKLAERAADELRRHRIEMERQDPSVRRRVAALKAAAFGDDRQSITYQHMGLDAEAQAKIDALKKPREFVSKIDETRLARPESTQE